MDGNSLPQNAFCFFLQDLNGPITAFFHVVAPGLSISRSSSVMFFCAFSWSETDITHAWCCNGDKDHWGVLFSRDSKQKKRCPERFLSLKSKHRVFNFEVRWKSSSHSLAPIDIHYINYSTLYTRSLQCKVTEQKRNIWIFHRPCLFTLFV